MKVYIGSSTGFIEIPDDDSGGSGGLGGAWFETAASTVGLPDRLKFLVDCQGNPVQIDFSAATLPGGAIIIISDRFNQSSVNPITLIPPTGVGASDPSAPGTYPTTYATLSGQAQQVMWQYVADINKLVRIA